MTEQEHGLWNQKINNLRTLLNKVSESWIINVYALKTSLFVNYTIRHCENVVLVELGQWNKLFMPKKHWESPIWINFVVFVTLPLGSFFAKQSQRAISHHMWKLLWIKCASQKRIWQNVEAVRLGTAYGHNLLKTCVLMHSTFRVRITLMLS